MRKQDTISKKRMAQILKEEIAAFQLDEQILREHEAAIKARKDVKSLVAEEFIKRYYGSHIDIHRMDEGMWDKIKGGLAKMGQISNLIPGQKAKKAKSAEDLAAALEVAGENMFTKVLQTLKKAGFPNNESSEQFRANVNSIVQTYLMVIASVEAGKTPYEAGVKTLELLQQYVTNAATQLKSIYGVTNEEIEAEKLAEAEEAEEAELLDEIEKLLEEDGPILEIEFGAREARIAAKVAEKGMGSRPARVAWRMAKRAVNRGELPGEADSILTKLNDAGGFAAELSKRAEMAGGRRYAKMAAEKGVEIATKKVPGIAQVLSTTTTAKEVPEVIVNTIKRAPTLGGLAAYLGVTPMMVGAAGLAAAAGFLFYKNRKSSRAAQLKDMGPKMVVPPDLKEKSIDAEDLMTKDIDQEKEKLAQTKGEETGGEVGPGGETVPDVTGDLEDVEDVYVFRGKGGKGIQSQLAKAGIKGPPMSALLKGLRADLSAAGFNVLEEAIFGSVLAEIGGPPSEEEQEEFGTKTPQQKGEETVQMQPGAGDKKDLALDNTIAALEQIQDPKQKEAARNIISTVLSKHGSLPPGFTTAAAPAAAPAAAAPAAAPGAEPAPAAGEAPAAAPAAGEPAAAGEEETGEMSDTELMQNLKKSKKKKGWTGNVGSIMEKEKQQIHETLDRWQKIAGIIKG